MRARIAGASLEYIREMEGNVTNIQLESKRRIRRTREALGLSQAKFAEKVNMSTEAYRRIEVGPVNIPIELLYEIENKFNISPTYIISGKEENSNDCWVEIEHIFADEFKNMDARLKKYIRKVSNSK